MKLNYFQRVKYEADWNDQEKGYTHRRWMGPRGKALTGTAKQLARLMWDRRRFA